MAKKIKFTLRNENGLHCRFCGDIYNNENRVPRYIALYETSPIKGIVCLRCKGHLNDYLGN